ncbi:hypothetical protein EV714DRAFT_240427, partial [Schizophyllum commune]
MSSGTPEWTGHPHWVGEHRARDAAVARLYSGKRRISKGKKHERIAHIVRRKRAVRMRDMAKRVREYKELYRRRRLDPLALVVMYNRMGPQVLICSTSAIMLGFLYQGQAEENGYAHSRTPEHDTPYIVLQTNYAALQAECRDLQSTTSRLSSTIEYYKRNVAILKDDIEILKGRNGRMAQRVEELEAEKLTRHPGSLLDEAQDDSHREAEAQVKSSELEKMTNDLANLRRDFAAVNQALRQAEVQAKSAKDALLRAQGARDKAEARLVDAEKRAALAEARAAAAEKSAALAQERAAAAEGSAASAQERAAAAEGSAASAQERAAAAEGSAASAQERATAAEGSAASAQKRAVVAEERERSALVKLTAATADVTTANARAEDAEARAMAIAENQRIIHAAHAKAELEASQAAAMYKEARKDRDTMEAECVRLRRELDAQSSFISSIRAQVASLPGCLDQQANRDVSTPPLAHAPPNRLPAAALDADSSTEASPGIAISRKVTPMPVTVQGSIDPGDADENESETEAQQQDDLDDSPGEVGG